MKRFLKSIGLAAGAVVVTGHGALAAFNALPAQNISNLVGNDTADTGIYEIVANQEVLIFAIVTMVMATAGFMLFRTWLRRGRG